MNCICMCIVFILLLNVHLLFEIDIVSELLLSFVFEFYLGYLHVICN